MPDPADEWRTAGWIAEGVWRRRTAIAAVSPSVTLQPWWLVDLGDSATGSLKVSRAGTLAAADVDVCGETVTLVSLYAAWEKSPAGRGYADAAAHRLLSDLSGIATNVGSRPILAAGDLNILNRYGEHGDPYWAARYASVFDRAEAMGLSFVGPQAPHGRQADPSPSELPSGSRDVPTYHNSGQDPFTATRQLDFVFASRALADRLTVRALNTDRDEWGPSDHCRIAIDLACRRESRPAAGRRF